jgi:hypothetical protein
MGVLQRLGSNDTMSDLLEDNRNTNKTVSHITSNVEYNMQ